MTSGVLADGDESGLSVTTEIEADRTVVVVEGTRDVAVVVTSPSGERVYLPPEAAGRERDSGSTAHDDSPYDGIPTESPYEGIPAESPYEGIPAESPYEGIPAESPYEGIPTESPYEGVSAGSSDDGGSIDSPYEGLSDDSADESATATGVVPTERGFRLVHPEPAIDVRFLR